MGKRKAIRVSGGYAIKRKARVEHECHDCGRDIERGEEYYQLTLEGFRTDWVTRCICEQCWEGRKLEA